MEMTSVQFPPYLPSLEWLRNKEDFAEMSTREFSRTLVASNSGKELLLTVPVVGGASALKRCHPQMLEISSHGDWTRIHIGAIGAAYGKEPFFQHFFPPIEAEIINYPSALADLNSRLLVAILSCLDYDKDKQQEFAEFKTFHPSRYRDIRSLLELKVFPRRSVIEALFRLGPDLAFLL